MCNVEFGSVQCGFWKCAMWNLEVRNVEFGSAQCGIWKCAMSNLEVRNFEVNTALTGHRSYNLLVL